MEPALVAVTLFTLAGLSAIILIADKKLAESEREKPSPNERGRDSLEPRPSHPNVH